MILSDTLSSDISAEPERTEQAIKEGWSFIPLQYHKRRDGTVFPVEMICNELVIDDRRTIVGTSRDISYRMRAQEAVQEANRKLNLLTSITRHDLNNQLTVLTGYLQLVDQKDPKTFGHVEKCRSIAESDTKDRPVHCNIRERRCQRTSLVRPKGDHYKSMRREHFWGPHHRERCSIWNDGPCGPIDSKGHS